MSAVSKVTLDHSKLTRLLGDLRPRAERILTQAATEIQAGAIVRTERVDTSAMKNGWRVEQENELQRTIYNTQEYAIYHELGTSKMSASPMLVPAVEQYRQKLTDAWKRLFDL